MHFLTGFPRLAVTKLSLTYFISNTNYISNLNPNPDFKTNSVSKPRLLFQTFS